MQTLLLKARSISFAAALLVPAVTFAQGAAGLQAPEPGLDAAMLMAGAAPMPQEASWTSPQAIVIGVVIIGLLLILIGWISKRRKSGSM